MVKFVKMINDKEPNNLLIQDEWEDGYEDESLLDISENIIFEFYDLKHDNSYLKSRDANIKSKIELQILDGLLELFEIDKELALKTIIRMGRKYKTAKQVQKAIDNRVFDIKVKKVKAEAESKGYVKQTFEEMCVPIEDHFKIQLDNKITVKKFVAYDNRLKALKSA